MIYDELYNVIHNYMDVLDTLANYLNLSLKETIVFIISGLFVSIFTIIVLPSLFLFIGIDKNVNKSYFIPVIVTGMVLIVLSSFCFVYMTTTEDMATILIIPASLYMLALGLITTIYGISTYLHTKWVILKEREVTIK